MDLLQDNLTFPADVQISCVHDESTVNYAIDSMAKEISGEIGDARPAVVCVMVGGMFITSQLCHRFDFPFSLSYVHATRYRGNLSGEHVQWKVSPGGELVGKDVLLVDDILDEGYTLLAICDRLQAVGINSLRVAVLTQKQHNRCISGITADYVGLQVPDKYVFGCGMDYKGMYRQLKQIYMVDQQKH